MDSKYRSYLAELIGTFALVFVGAGTICATKQLAEVPGQAQPYTVGIALAQGFILAAALTATVPVSGGYLNPALTLTLWVFRRVEGSRVLWLIGAQLLGGGPRGAGAAPGFCRRCAHSSAERRPAPQPGRVLRCGPIRLADARSSAASASSSS